MLGDEENSDLKYIKNYIINLNELRQIFTLSSQAQLFRNSNTPFLHFLTTLMEKRKTVQASRTTISKAFTQYFSECFRLEIKYSVLLECICL